MDLFSAQQASFLTMLNEKVVQEFMLSLLTSLYPSIVKKVLLNMFITQSLGHETGPPVERQEPCGGDLYAVRG